MNDVAICEYTWRGDAGLGGEELRAFRDLLPYCFPPGSVWRWAGTEVPVVHFTTRTPEEVRLVNARLDAVLARTGERQRSGPARTLLDQWDAEIGGIVLDPPDIRRVGPGLDVIGPGPALLLQAVDRVAADLAARLGASEYVVPHLVSWDTLERGGYPRTFPQHVTACAVVRPELEALDGFAAATSADERARHLEPAPVTVSPTVCLHLFAAYAGQTLDRPVIATARQSCGRFEAGAAGVATRLWSFTMREIIYIGDGSGARQFRDEMLLHLKDLIRELGLPARLTGASDPFFTIDRSQLASYQSTWDLKQELCGRMREDSSSVAVSSVNLHHQHFGKSFEITLADGKAAASTCTGFGLDRWARWLHGHLGPNPADWPAPLRRATNA
ncbi:hypothetical protein [Actinoplanes xinjiangensis]|uniref:tRNA synthetase class II (G, H, P, S and T) n=1 Tax=Actinoplanes xinjiangensis TaxID=512350 RepID=A0A316EW72_9ACTN|nr:hypothetical protein [Actinoplanes xinjiangensis]PWK36085.1 hypothetical protein BC793_12466 [Actinoplanes xinjiangensis]GIF42911.1 hypothetical protein Axi01nite_72220 [Actinoplanes xinjiangensis]